MTDIKKSYALFLAVIVCLAFAMPCFAMSFYSSSAYVNSVARFIAGTKAKIGGGVFMALDAREKQRRGAKVLFKGTDVSSFDMLQAYYDPAKLPYVAQAVMRVMSETDKANYGYYQRRLAEFQASLDSAVNVGRYSIPKNCKMLDLTRVEGALISSAAEHVQRVPRSDWKRWISGDTESLVQLLEKSDAEGAIVLVDRWTPPVVRNCLAGYKKKITLPAADMSGNYFDSVNSIYRYVAKRIKDFEKNKPVQGDK